MRISVGLKLMILSGIGSVMLASAAFYGTWHAWHSVHSLHLQLDQADSGLHRIHTIQTEYKTEIQEWKNILLRSTDNSSLDRLWNIYQTQFDKVSALLTEAASLAGDNQEKTMLAAFAEAHQQNRELYKKSAAALREHNFDIRLADRMAMGIDREPMNYLANAVHQTMASAEKTSSGIVSHAERKIYTSSAILIAAFLLEGVLFIVFIRRFLTTPTAKVLDGLNTLKSGDFTAIIPKTYNDEIGGIAESIQHVSEELGRLVFNVKTAAHRLADTAQRVAMVSSMTSEGVKNQREETDNASRSMQEMSDSMQLSVERADEAVTAASTVSQQVSVVGSVLGDTVRAVQALADEVKNTAQAIQSLKDETQSIGDVAKTIRSIADQTNLLALNAAIEAARAGEQGRGFAVVADEVRKLAQITQNATSDIEQRIETLQGGASNAMAAMIEGCNRADKSVEQAIEARKVLDSITQAAASIREINERIVAILESQKDVASSISATIMNISQVAEQTSHSSRQTSEEIVHVAAEAVRLDEMVEKFILPVHEAQAAQDALPSQHPAAKDDSVELF